MLGMHPKIDILLQLFHHEYLIIIIRQNIILEYQMNLQNDKQLNV